jgi:hypothetical protein
MYDIAVSVVACFRAGTGWTWRGRSRRTDSGAETSLFGRGGIGGPGEEAERLFSRATSGTTVADDTVITVLWPVPKL